MAKAAQLNLAEGWAAGPPQAADQSGFAAAGPSEQRAATTSPYRGASSMTNGNKQPDPAKGRGSPKSFCKCIIFA